MDHLSRGARGARKGAPCGSTGTSRNVIAARCSPSWPIGQQIDAAVAVGELVKDEAEEVLIDGRALDARKPLAFTPSKHR